MKRLGAPSAKRDFSDLKLLFGNDISFFGRLNFSLAIAYLLFAAIFSIPDQTFADVPDLIPVQGVLSDISDQPIDGSVAITFALYNSESRDEVVWTDVFSEVKLDKGFFTVYLGSNKKLSFADLSLADQLWLGVKIENDIEMPLIRLASVPFAGEAQICRNFGELDEQDAMSLSKIIDTGCDSGKYFQGFDSDGNIICVQDKILGFETDGGQNGIVGITAGDGILVDRSSNTLIISLGVHSHEEYLTDTDMNAYTNTEDMNTALAGKANNSDLDAYQKKLSQGCGGDYIVESINTENGTVTCKLKSDFVESSWQGIVSHLRLSAHPPELDGSTVCNENRIGEVYYDISKEASFWHMACVCGRVAANKYTWHFIGNNEIPCN